MPLPLWKAAAPWVHRSPSRVECLPPSQLDRAALALDSVGNAKGSLHYIQHEEEGGGGGGEETTLSFPKE